MKSTKRSPKPPKQELKPNDQSQKLDFVAYKPVEKQQPTSQPDITPSDDLPSLEQPAQAEVIPPLKSKPNAVEKPQHLEKSKAERTSGDKRKSKSPQQSKQQGQLTKGDDEQELPPERCQHIQFLDCNSSVGRIIFECYHCQQGIISEYIGEPVMGEYKGHPSLIQVKVQCPNCEQTAIRLTTGQVLSTTAIPSPWQE
ncbi:hypothetical protein COO91_09216 (plasmid) [Nostoc flagelliforme CCNUN1]|uniref:Uncharacterized protein n=1 Tax=Nostoc flagelliforme CCNUN1 TaxID=2038116 RepID=A0A2K8T608_9NOSO|nr:hypothetical protein [Nostoc flagelliforme]AUB43060.1 hypothetical protein COO91_09216 [Nostoc flagelliforme CCNUN1]